MSTKNFAAVLRKKLAQDPELAKLVKEEDERLPSEHETREERSERMLRRVAERRAWERGEA